MSKSLRKRIIKQLACNNQEKFNELLKRYSRTQLSDLKLLIKGPK